MPSDSADTTVVRNGRGAGVEEIRIAQIALCVQLSASSTFDQFDRYSRMGELGVTGNTQLLTLLLSDHSNDLRRKAAGLPVVLLDLAAVARQLCDEATVLA
jgi:hypothetical protein